MTRILITPPTIEPISLTELKAHARIETDVDDDLVQSYIKAAREHIEMISCRMLITQTWRVFFDHCPPDSILNVSLTPVQAVSLFTIHDEAGASHDLAPSDYSVDILSDPARIKLQINPAALAGVGAVRPFSGLEVDVIAGYGDTADKVPADLKQAVLLLSAYWYDHRTGPVPGSNSSIMSALDALLAPYKRIRL